MNGDLLLGIVRILEMLGVGLMISVLDRPENPLQVLGEFLLQRSRDLEAVKQESAA